MLIFNISYLMFLPEKTCPTGWSEFSCSCYLLSENSGSWHSARKHCTDQGADLVVIDSPEEQVQSACILCLLMNIDSQTPRCYEHDFPQFE